MPLWLFFVTVYSIDFSTIVTDLNYFYSAKYTSVVSGVNNFVVVDVVYNYYVLSDFTSVPLFNNFNC